VRALSSVSLRLFLCSWIVFAVHFATNIVREHYPAFSLIEEGHFQVDRYVGFHADIFEHDDGHAYVMNNVFGSVVAALPLVLFDPLLDALEERSQAALEASGGAVEVEYDTKYPNRRDLFRRVREAGLDLRFGASAAITSVFLMAPLSALAIVLVYRLLRRRAIGETRAIWLALLFGFGTPLFYRTAHLSHNVLLMHALFGAFLCLWARPDERLPVSTARRAWAGFLCGAAFALDYAGVIPAGLLFLYLVGERRRSSGLARSLGESVPFVLGALPPVLFLFASQWAQFGHPFKPAQFYMPEVNYTDQGVQGMTWPRLETFVKNLFAPGWGLVPFAPLLVIAFWPTGRRRADERIVPRRERAWFWAIVVTFMLFCASNQYALMQFNTGFRYFMPLVPFLFLLASDHLVRMRTRTLAVVSVLVIGHTWVLSMTREVNDTEKDLRDLAAERGVGETELDGYWTAILTEAPVPMAYRRIVTEGPQLPWLKVLVSTPLGRSSPLAHPLAPIAVLVLTGLVVGGLWWLGERGRPRRRPFP